MDYNTSKNKLLLREYGRNVQKLIEHALTITDNVERNHFAQAIIELMGNLNPHLKNVEDFKHLLWDHLFIISDFKLDVESPYPIIDKIIYEEKPKPLAYPQKPIQFKHYGGYIKMVIDKAKKLDDEKRTELSKYIASYMKLVHRSWNNETVNDEIVKNDLKLMSNGVLKLEDDESIRVLMKNTGTGTGMNRNNNNNQRNNSTNTNTNRNSSSSRNNNNRNNNNRNSGPRNNNPNNRNKPR